MGPNSQASAAKKHFEVLYPKNKIINFASAQVTLHFIKKNNFKVFYYLDKFRRNRDFKKLLPTKVLLKMPKLDTQMYISFQDLVQELDKFFKEEWIHLETKKYSLDPSNKDDILLANIRLDLEEASHTYFMLYKSLLMLREDQRYLLTDLTNNSFQQKMKNTQRLAMESSILIKSIYNYLFAIREMLFSSKELKKLLREQTVNELNRVCEFRSKLIVHKQNQKIFTGAGRKYNTEDLNLTLQIGQYANVSKDIIKQCRKLYQSSKNLFPKEDQSHDNYYLMADTLYSNLHLVPKKLQAEVKGFISAFGASSDPPYKLGVLLKNLLFEYLNFFKEFK